MALTEHQLLARARWSFEAGRVRLGLREAWPVLPVAAIALIHHRPTPLLVAGCLFLTLLGIFLGWRGQAFRAAWRVGLVAGAIPLLLPLVVPENCVGELGGLCVSACLVSCPLSGGIAGVIVGTFAARQVEGRLLLLAAAGLVTVLTGAFGCALAGSAGLLGMVAGTLLVSAPTYWKLAAPRWPS